MIVRNAKAAAPAAAQQHQAQQQQQLPNPTHTFKIVLYSHQAAGKTSLSRALVSPPHQHPAQVFDRKYEMTIGVDLQQCLLLPEQLPPSIPKNMRSSIIPRLVLLECVGGSRFRTIVTGDPLSKTSDAFLLVYDVNDAASFATCERLIGELLAAFSLQNFDSSKKPVLIVGNKLDLKDASSKDDRAKQRQHEKLFGTRSLPDDDDDDDDGAEQQSVPVEKVQSLAEQCGAIFAGEVSCKNGVGLDSLRNLVVERLVVAATGVRLEECGGGAAGGGSRVRGSFFGIKRG